MEPFVEAHRESICDVQAPEWMGSGVQGISCPVTCGLCLDQGQTHVSALAGSILSTIESGNSSALFIKAYVRDIAGSASDHGNESNIAIKQVIQVFLGAPCVKV